MTQATIKRLKAIPRLKVECPHCEEVSLVKRIKMFGMYDPYPTIANELIQMRLESAKAEQKELKERRRRLSDSRKHKPRRIEVAAETSTFGQISEQILPAFTTFPYKQSDCRVLLKPIDYIVFEGLSAKRRVDAIKLIDVKTGNGRLTNAQRQVRNVVSEGKVKHKVIG